jgi:hypothetical protein
VSNLIALELARALARRVTKLFAVGALAAILTAGIAVFFAHSGRVAEAPSLESRPEYTACLRGDFLAPGEEIVLPDEGAVASPAIGTAEREEFCRTAVEAFTFDPGLDDRYHFASFQGALLGTTPPLSMLALILGATLIGAEWRANTIATQLTWEPRRIRVLAAKAIVAALMGAAFYLLVQVVLGGALTPAALWRGTTEGIDGAWWRESIGILARGSAFAAMSATIGFAIATVGRNTTAALGVMFGYFAILEGTLLGNIWPWIRRWLMIGNSIVFVGGESSPDIAGRSVIGAGILLGIYAAGAWALSALWFSRRDVT